MTRQPRSDTLLDCLFFLFRGGPIKEGQGSLGSRSAARGQSRSWAHRARCQCPRPVVVTARSIAFCFHCRPISVVVRTELQPQDRPDLGACGLVHN